jgi:ribonuclease VapC
VTIDSSALLAILLGEAGALDLVDVILEADTARVGAPTLVETAIVLGNRRGKPSIGEVVGLIEELGVTVVPFDTMQMTVAVDAFERFGRGRHKAALNFGHCLAYATAATARDSLLFVGQDFAKTDIRRP